MLHVEISAGAALDPFGGGEHWVYCFSSEMVQPTDQELCRATTSYVMALTTVRSGGRLNMKNVVLPV